jgi:hypothetical protein
MAKKVKNAAAPNPEAQTDPTEAQVEEFVKELEEAADSDDDEEAEAADDLTTEGERPIDELIGE